MHTSTCFLFILALQSCKTISSSDHDRVSTAEDTFRGCLISQTPGVDSLGHCLKVGVVSKLQSWDNEPEFDLADGVTLTRDKEFREAYNFEERAPADFRSLIDTMGHIFAHRNLQWNMGFLYPGLQMRVTPSVNSAGTLEFVLDPRRELLQHSQHSLSDLNTGSLLARQFMLPFLLGFKFNVSTIIPILFGLLALIAKKAVILSKLALIVSSAYGLGALMLGNENSQEYYNRPLYSVNNPTHAHHHQYTGLGGVNPAFGGVYNRYTEEYPSSEPLYRGILKENPIEALESNNNNNNNNSEDQFRLHGSIQEVYKRENSVKGRNFAWSDNEKEKKSQ